MKPEPWDLDEILKDPDKLLKRLVRGTRMLSQPIDFADLQRRGILSKDGAWYRVSNLWDLPEHAAKKIYELERDSGGFRVRFTDASEYEELAKSFEQIAYERGLF
jgi:hypothetical protein